MSQSPVMSPLSEGALRGNEPSPTGVNYTLSPLIQAPITRRSPLSWMSTPQSVQTPRSVDTLGSVQTNNDSRVTPMDLSGDFRLERGGKKTRTKKTRTKSKKSKKTRTYSKKTRTYSKKSKKTRKYNKRGGKGFTTSETNGKESQ